MKALLLVALAGIAFQPAWARQPAPLTLVKRISLPGVKGRIDHFSIDLKGRRLFMSALGNNSLEVFNLRTNRVVHSITGLSEPQGVTYVPESNRIFVANGGDGAVRIFDGSSYRQIGMVRFPSDADDTRYDQAARRLYVGYGEGGIGILDAMTGKLLGSIKIKGHPEAFEVESGGRRIYINDPDAGLVLVADAGRHAVVGRWPLRKFQQNFPMQFDRARRRLFVVTRKPAQLLVLNSANGKLIAHLPVVGDADDLWYDARRGQIYVSGGEGFITVIRQDDAGHYSVSAKISTLPGARTSFYSPELSRFYLAAPARNGRPAELRIYSVTAR